MIPQKYLAVPSSIKIPRMLYDNILYADANEDGFVENEIVVRAFGGTVSDTENGINLMDLGC